MLRQILPKIGAVIRTEGAVKVDSKRTMAWLSIEIRSKPGSKGLPEVQHFQSLPCMTEYEAQESASEQAICYFIARLNICINDLTYPALKETCNQLNHFMSWSQFVQTRYDMLRVQMDNMFRSHKKLLDRLGSICSANSDILSLATSLTSIGSEPLPGPDPRYIQLVEQLFTVVLENTPTYNLFGSP
jgi:hypothetical protein